MRNFIAFFQRFRIFLLFLILQTIALGMYFSWVSYPRTSFFNTSSSAIASLLEWERGITKHLFLDQANRELLKDYNQLLTKVPTSYIPIDTNVSLIKDTLRKLSFERIPATVINSSFSNKNNYFTINAGRIKGVQPKMGVISTKGVVGLVYDVSDHYAVVKSILTENINLSAYMDDSKAFGLIKYKGMNPLQVQLTGISNDIEVSEGVTVYTKGSGGFFPNGIPIGRINKFQAVEGMPLWKIDVNLFQDMRKLHYVFVIKNIYSEELEQLEANILNNE